MHDAQLNSKQREKNDYEGHLREAVALNCVFPRNTHLHNLSTVTKVQKFNIDAISYSDFTNCPNNVPHSHFFLFV